MSGAERRLRIVMVASEAVPFSKTGGLADVSGSLSRALDRAGHDVVLILPDYPALRQGRSEAAIVNGTGLQFSLDMNGRAVTAGLNWASLPDSQVRVLLVSQPEYFDRSHLYGDTSGSYFDNCERFCFFSRLIPEICRKLVLQPDILHCNDWHTGLIPALLNTVYAGTRGLEQTASVMTIHNLAYQGQFQDYEFPLTGMPRRYYNMYQMEAWGHLNLLKTGLSFADQLTTVSPSYADEICLPENGCGLDGVLRHRQSDLVGILNGIDEQIWDPAADPMISANYTLSSRASGKATCKQKLQEVFGLEQDPTTPLLGMVTRLADQKGLDLIAAGIERILAAGVQFVFLGTGDARYEQLLSALPRRFSGRIGGRIGFDEAAAHQIEAGADMFLMPSRFEPCGLNQMYSLRYGTVPVVRGVGGLADSVIDYDGQPGTLDRATGFAFREYSTDQLVQTIVRAVASYRQPDVWSRLVDNGMREDWSWDRSAAAYLQAYERALRSVSSRQQAGRC